MRVRLKKKKKYSLQQQKQQTNTAPNSYERDIAGFSSRLLKPHDCKPSPLLLQLQITHNARQFPWPKKNHTWHRIRTSCVFPFQKPVALLRARRCVFTTDATRGQPSLPPALWPRLNACCCAEEQDVHKHEKGEIQPCVSRQCQFYLFFGSFVPFFFFFLLRSGGLTMMCPNFLFAWTKKIIPLPAEKSFWQRQTDLDYCAWGAHTGRTHTHRCCNTTTRTQRVLAQMIF